MTLEGRWPEAEKEYRRAVQLKEDQPGTHYNLGRVLFMEGKQEEAEKEYRRAIQIKDDIPNGHYNLGLVLQRQGKFGEAIPYFQTAMALLPAGDSLRDAMQMQISVCQPPGTRQETAGRPPRRSPGRRPGESRVRRPLSAVQGPVRHGRPALQGGVHSTTRPRGRSEGRRPL